MAKRVCNKNRRVLSEIKIAILELCLIPHNRTNIMYGCRLSFKTSMECLNSLIEKGLINISNPVKVYGTEYLTNSEGIKIIIGYNKIKKLMDVLNE